MNLSKSKPIEILLVEDSPSDAALTIEALKEGKIANNLTHVEDGVVKHITTDESLPDESGALQLREHYLSLSTFYQSKRDLLISALQSSRFKISPTKGTYFQMLNYSNISDKNDMDFSAYLTKDIGVAVIPISPFCSLNKSRKMIRVCFAKKDEILLQAAEKLNSV